MEKKLYFHLLTATNWEGAPLYLPQTHQHGQIP